MSGCGCGSLCFSYSPREQNQAPGPKDALTHHGGADRESGRQTGHAPGAAAAAAGTRLRAAGTGGGQEAALALGSAAAPGADSVSGSGSGRSWGPGPAHDPPAPAPPATRDWPARRGGAEPAGARALVLLLCGAAAPVLGSPAPRAARSPAEGPPRPRRRRVRKLAGPGPATPGPLRSVSGGPPPGLPPQSLQCRAREGQGRRLAGEGGGALFSLLGISLPRRSVRTKGEMAAPTTPPPPLQLRIWGGTPILRQHAHSLMQHCCVPDAEPSAG